MKKIILLAMISIVAFGSVFAEDRYDKKAKQVAKEMTSGKKDKVTGLREPIWRVPLGAQPLEMQLAKSYRMADEMTEDGDQKWITGDAQSVGQTYDAAKKQALSLAIGQLAQKIQSTIAEEINTANGNSQLGKGEAVSVVKTVTGSTQWVTGTIKKVITIMEAYQNLPNQNFNVRVVVAYNQQKAMDAAKDALREEMLKKGHQLSVEMKKLLGEK